METEAQPSNGVPDSGVLSTSAPAPTTDSVVFKVVSVLVLLAGFFGGGALMLVGQTGTAIDKHAERPHVGAATKEDIADLKSDLGKLDGKLDRVLEAVSAK